MSTWRSEVMHHGTLVLPGDYAKHFLSKLGDECLIQLTDMNEHVLSRPYRAHVQRLDDLDTKLSYLIDIIDGLPGVEYRDRETKLFLEYTSTRYNLEEIEKHVTHLYDEFVQFTRNNQEIAKSIAHAYEYRELLKSHRNVVPDISGDLTETHITTLCGVLTADKVERFHRQVNYVTRGNAFFTTESLAMEGYRTNYMTDNSKKAAKKSKKAQKKQAKTVKKLSYDPSGIVSFVLSFQGSKHSVLHEKIIRILDGAEGRLYAWPVSKLDADQKLKDLDITIDADTKALDHYCVLLLHEIQELLEPTFKDGNVLIADWALAVEKEKATYAALNMFEPVADTVRCDIWFPAFEEKHIEQVLAKNRLTGVTSPFLISEGPTQLAASKVPTFFRNTGFTRGYQNFVNTYGFPRYREINPALITSVTLPYLFGIMYGDVGHGAFVMLFGLAMILNYDALAKMKQELVTMMLGGRYMLFMMGCFAIYTGFIYNDVLSVGMDLFGTRYYSEGVSGDVTTWKPSAAQESFPYPFGFDPVWKAAVNELTFLNSFKMKFSIIVAGLHMGLGVMLKGANTMLNSDWISFFCEFVPQILFFATFVWYLDFMIIYKWIVPGVAPNLINAIIEFGMFKEPEMILYAGQYTVQRILWVIMVCCIPWMLVPKPLLMKMKYGKVAKKKGENLEKLKVEDNSDLEGGKVELAKKPLMVVDEEEEYNFGEEFIHQLIETIEFALGAISNTASYLRLWALSLAHQQLAIVFFDMTIGHSIEAGYESLPVQIVMNVLMFGAFAGCTFVVMLAMDALECYLHALRLQWVEFQSKFFGADGFNFRAFNYTIILLHIDDEE